ncbi:MAG TPA: sulfate adenylyltransferase [Dehalococcoidia bacterium]|nr:sulfate adenylyltransferase [Dehalococcoidia bacterium]
MTIPAPHGGTLVNRVLSGDEARSAEQTASNLKKAPIGERVQADLELIAIGGLSPLTGFMGQADYRAVVEEMRLANGLPWTIPVVLDVDAETGKSLENGERLALVDDGGQVAAVLTVDDVYSFDAKNEARKVYRTDEDAHPGVAAVYARGEMLVSGPVDVLRLPEHDFPELRLKPAETRAAFAEKGWQTVVGFQTRNPIHRAHEYLQKVALEIVDGLLVHPLVGATKSDDIPADVRIRCYKALLENYYPKDRTLLSLLPAAMRYAGPREAIFHALMRKNYGCSHFIVGRDHAGVGSYYGTYDAQKIFAEFDPAALGITPLMFENSFYCRACEGMASNKTCPHDGDSRVILSGTQVREMLARGEEPPHEFTRSEVARVLIESMRR